MSLRAFHILFIVTALSLMGFLAYWSGRQLREGKDGQNRAMLVCAVAGMALGVPYLGWFIRKTKSLS